jgi:hypothetical protein
MYPPPSQAWQGDAPRPKAYHHDIALYTQVSLIDAVCPLVLACLGPHVTQTSEEQQQHNNA